MNFSTRLRELREENNLTQETIASLLNLTKANISKYELGKLQPSIETLKLLSNYFNVSIDYLIGITNIKKTEDNDFSKIPIFEINKSTPAIFVAENIAGYDYINKSEDLSKDYFFFKVKDDSMSNARIFKNDLVCIYKQDYIEDNKLMLIHIKNIGVLLRRIIKCKDNLIILPENHKYNPVVLSKKNLAEDYLKVIGKAVYVKFYIDE
ncbi:transcriptional regulator [Clostridium pasteurianum DSM 525 = ATCC 6013]|uniref:Transcriptional regulator n=1 Tax=Clostridium pasteurianum DSM 525 = ATCC 6013 TaxID=1262449 RepID=A0A0H3J1U3_CLOPA|nr:LexA family transcriptional regulator [Clostridium pasteurianum]AJA47871.1 transcriptional regulator [Clostridium pasteurianum DSM 525 = ATCC 6013]AJA51859.1 transcriptional regulator [Clostridium pasteurianum DSM 525 = ATCC 6013]AOZ75162.1 transcriptional regulator [Clostridium pasteurianum DSM 525 = ATCC 6013]AOZ78957.1 transcriptional regulator [Clostridium pasteurianum]ELP59774.1 transcriptional regulator [Clostridium pasteurianum DSM 525 = ATCC 6013]